MIIELQKALGISHMDDFNVENGIVTALTILFQKPYKFSNLKTPLGQTALQIPQPTHEARTISS